MTKLYFVESPRNKNEVRFAYV